jgi:hypothetical protein
MYYFDRLSCLHNCFLSCIPAQKSSDLSILLHLGVFEMFNAWFMYGKYEYNVDRLLFSCFYQAQEISS